MIACRISRLALICAVGTYSTVWGARGAHASLLKTRSADAVHAVCKQTLRALMRDTLRIEAMQGSSEQKFRALNTMAQRWMGLDGEVSLLGSVHPNPQVREAAEECSRKLTADAVARQQRPKLYAQIKSLKPADAIDAKMKQDWLDAFEDTGVHLPAAQRQRVKEISDRLTALSIEYDRRIRDDDSTFTFTHEEMRGVPESVLKSARRDAAGNYVVGFSYPESDPIFSFMEDGQARARYALAAHARGGERNVEILKETLKLRQELATLLGHPDFATFVIRRRMARTPATVRAFLAQVRAALAEPVKAEHAELLAEKARHLGKPIEAVKLLRSDRAFYTERIRKARFAIDQEALRKYFPTEASVQWVLHLASTLYGISFQEINETFWHPEARLLKVTDTQTKSLLGWIHLDLFPRDGKYNHAAVWPVTASSSLLKQRPRSVLVANLSRRGLTLDELETLIHEFGHALHGVLSQTRYVEHGGTATERDFVEAPSQMFEHWARRKESLQQMVKFCNGCPIIDDAMVERLQQARAYGQAMRYIQQHQFAAYDLALNTDADVDPMKLWEQMESDQPWGYNGNQFPRQFGHLMGYAAAYYGYMWSEVLALDMLSTFGANVMNPAIGRRFRDTILSRGAERPASEMVRAFLGREPRTEAFFKEITGKRLHP